MRDDGLRSQQIRFGKLYGDGQVEHFAQGGGGPAGCLLHELVEGIWGRRLLHGGLPALGEKPGGSFDQFSAGDRFVKEDMGPGLDQFFAGGGLDIG